MKRNANGAATRPALTVLRMAWGHADGLAPLTVRTPRNGWDLATLYAASRRYAREHPHHHVPEHKLSRAAFRSLTAHLDAGDVRGPGSRLRVSELRDRLAGRGLDSAESP